MRRPFKIVLGVLACAAFLTLAAGMSFLLVIQTDWFKNQVRQRIVSVVENATGGRVEIGRFNYDWHALTAEVSPFVLHGTEPPGSSPFLRAARIRVGLKIISAFKKQVDIASLEVDQPQAVVVVSPDGSTNVPRPKTARTQQNFADELLNLRVRHFELRDGFAVYNSKRVPLDMQGEHLQASVVYDPSGPCYRGDVSSRLLRVSSPELKQPVTFDLATKVELESNAVRVLEATASNGAERLQVKGSVNNLASPRADFDVVASAPVGELKKIFPVPMESRGEVGFQGHANYESASGQYKADGKLTARGLAYRYDNTAITNIAAVSNVELTPGKLRLNGLDIAALDGHFRGSAEVADFRKLIVSGETRGFLLRDLVQLGGREPGRLAGILSGPLRLNGDLSRGTLRNLKAQAQLAIAPGTGGTLVEGSINVGFDQAANRIELGTSEITLGSTHATLAGVLGEKLSVHVVSQNLDDALALFPLFGETPPKQLPVALDGSSATFDGSISGALSDPHVSGKADLGAFTVNGHRFDRLSASIDAGASLASFRTLTVTQGKTRIDGQGQIGLRNWKAQDSSSISGLVSIAGADIQTLAEEVNQKSPASGTISGTLHISGTVETPIATGTVEGSNISAQGEHADSVRGDITASATSIEIASGIIASRSARITLSGAYNHPAKDWKDGSLRFRASSSQLTLAHIQHVRDAWPGLNGELAFQAEGTAKVVNGVIDLTSLTAQTALRNAVLDGKPYGDLELNASTRLPILGVSARVNLGGIQIQGSGEWRMEGDYTGQARFQIPRVPFATLHDLVPGQRVRATLPFDGFLEGEATVTGALNNPAAMKADVTLSTVQFSANPGVSPTGVSPKGGAQAQDLVLRNAEPMRLEVTNKAINIRTANFTARDTSLTASGRLTFDTKNPWDLNVAGRINLSILQIFNPNLLASGASVVTLGVRGPLMEPQVDGRLALQNASLFLRDFPTGVDQANGLILFDRNRATVQSLTALAGGGNVKFEPGSFVGFRGAALLYRLQASAQNVRYRTEDGISITVDGNAALVGTSDSSVLSGTVRVARAAFNPRTDVGALLASTQRPVSMPSEPNEYLKGVQFDVQIESARALEVQTSLTRNIEADVNLRLRGTPDRPVLIGTISVNAGQIEFFGNKYAINRGEIRFYNPLHIEPVLDMDLETQVRGISVDVSFSGSLNKLNFSYRSDPPLQSNDIIALLAVGRAPSATGPLGAAQATDTSFVGGAGGALLGQAIAPATGRLQKLFGVSHIKIDPQITDVTSLPQARLTFEQQVSNAVTLTYITNLAVANQQIVRLEWDLNKRWSVVALRDENGAFSIDFQYKRSFK